MIESILDGDISPRKYIRICEGVLRVKIERGGKIYIKNFKIRMNGGIEKAMEMAIKWRDKKHMDLFGLPVTERIIHIKSKRNNVDKINPETGEILPKLRPGLSYGFHDGSLRYVVCSYQIKDKTIRKRFPVKADGVDKAILMASEFRDKVIFCSE